MFSFERQFFENSRYLFIFSNERNPMLDIFLFTSEELIPRTPTECENIVFIVNN